MDNEEKQPNNSPAPKNNLDEGIFDSLCLEKGKISNDGTI